MELSVGSCRLKFFANEKELTMHQVRRLNMTFKTYTRLGLASFFLMLCCSFASAQELLLDQMREAGGLKLFPIYGDPKSFYYLPDKVTIPNGPNGKKQFSFLKFIEEGAGSGEGGVQTTQGGGLVSFLVSLEVSDQILQRAQAELQSKVSGAKIVGPITYREGTFALVSNFQQEDGDWATRVLGMGKAPIMEGHKAAVSIRLTRVGATLLWESFQQAASDISISFDMTIAGYRNPYEAKMTAWWERVAKNRSLNVGVATDFLGVDIQEIMRELRDQGAIELEVKGEDEKMDRLWEMAYGKITEIMFEQNNDPTTMATLQDDPNVFSNFDRAHQFNTEVRERINRENQTELDREARERQRLAGYADQWALLGHIARSDSTPAHTSGSTPSSAHPSSGSSRAATSSRSNGPVAGNPSSTGNPGSSNVRPANLQTPPSFSVLASYRKKEFKKSGKFELSFKKWTPDTQAMRFDENIGGFGKKLINDPAHFRIVNLDDPAYKIREILVQLDGQNSSDFEKFVNFVTVGIRKTHQDGYKHFDELKIDRQNFTKTSNNFTMTYGYHGDTNRDKWKKYEYQITWNLFGGAQWTSDWKETEDFIIPVVPPHRYREIIVEADPEVFTAKEVRLATVKFKSMLFGKTDTREITLKPGANAVLSQTIKYAHEPEKYDYLYDISWLKRGGTKQEVKNQKGDAAYLFADELPQ